MKMHAQHVQEQVRRLAKSEYWRQFERSPDLVVMFTPLESALIAALEVKPEHLNAGDVVVQRGTRHAWHNRSDEPCKIAFILIGSPNYR